MVRRVDEARQQFSASANIELAIEVFDVDMNRVRADAQVDGDLFFAVAGQESIEGLALARGEQRRRLGQQGGVARIARGNMAPARELYTHEAAQIGNHLTFAG